MLDAITNVTDYATKPTPMFYMRHPVRAMRVRRFRNDVKNTITSPRLILGVAAALIAIPLGVWLGRRFG